MSRGNNEGVVEAITTFVKWRGEVIAFFRAYRTLGERDFVKSVPVLKNGWTAPDRSYWAVDGYEHSGQHGEFDEEILRSCVKSGLQASEREYTPLKRELEDCFDYVIIPHQSGHLRLKGKWYRKASSGGRKGGL